MRETRMNLPEVALFAGTRAALGAGVGLLLADRMGKKERIAAGWALFAVGAATTVPLLMMVIGRLEKGGD